MQTAHPRNQLNHCTNSGPASTPPTDESVWAVHSRRFLGHLAAECGLAENTIEAYGRDLREFAAHLVERQIERPDDITPLIVQSHLIQLADRRLALASIARHLASLRMFLRFLY